MGWGGNKGAKGIDSPVGRYVHGKQNRRLEQSLGSQKASSGLKLCQSRQFGKKSVPIWLSIWKSERDLG